MKYDIQFKMKLTPSELKKFRKFLSKGPYTLVGKMIGKIDEQVAAQDTDAAAATALGDMATSE
jgi:hypothetical protein